MKVTFNVNFHTVWGQRLYVVGSVPELGNWNMGLAKVMNYVGDGNWQISVIINAEVDKIEYHYFIETDGKCLFEEGKSHQFFLKDKTKQYTLFDYWKVKPTHSSYYTSAFTKGFFAPSYRNYVRKIKSGKRLTIKISIPRVERNQSVVITGNQECLGTWNPQKAIPLDGSNYPIWQIDLDAEEIHYPLEYKFLILDNRAEVVCWEQGENRILNLPGQEQGETVIVSGLFFRDNLPDWKCAGTVIPLFSLRSTTSYGIGDFSDLYLLIDWVKLTHQRIIQLLPVNDTTMTYSWKDSYPYNAISIYALHPIYLSLSDLGKLKQPERMKYFHEKQLELNALQSIDYDNLIDLKLKYCHEFFDEQGMKRMNSIDYKNFYTLNKHWLLPYAVYSYLRDLNHTADFRKWKDYSIFDKVQIRQLYSPDNIAYHKIQFYLFLQFVLHQQFKEVSDYARKNGIVLKGDLPIGISPNSVEAWMEPRYFNMDSQAGAPPDDFSVEGQNWGFPTYNWEVMAEDNFSWWKKRFKKLSDYFDCIRIDHILGFFRIWEIPNDYVQGLCGHFNPALPLTKEEIEQYGFHFDESMFVVPQINEKNIFDLFGDQEEIVKTTYLVRISAEYYGLKSFCNTQRKIQNLFSGKNDDISLCLKKGLFSVANEVLFLRDPLKTDCFHPRISAFSSFRYKDLKESERYAFDQLYWDFFYHRHNEFWKNKALERLLPLINSTEMLICGEDLGMIPESVPDVMNKLQILSLEVERMPKKASCEFTDLKNLPYLSVCTSSTHDMSTLRGWWKEQPDKIQRYYNSVLGKEGKAPLECTGSIVSEILQHHLNSSSMLTIIPLQDWLAMDEKVRNPDVDSERINIPSVPDFNWKYRMHISLEDLLKENQLNAAIRRMIDAADRF